jgi:hypothetical protein
MKSQIIIESRFCGPPDNGNGGYTCGLLANFIKGIAEVTLRNPPPLNTPMQVEQVEMNKFCLFDQETLIAEAIPTKLDLTAPEPPTLEVAKVSTMKAVDIIDHYFPTCFVCGPQRDKGDGLRIFPGPVKGQNFIAATWIPEPSLSDETGYIKNEVIWAVMDCPSGWAVIQEKMRFILLGRLVVQIIDRVKPNEECIVQAWTISEDGRKIYAGTAIYSDEGQLYAKGKATWIEMK